MAKLYKGHTMSYRRSMGMMYATAGMGIAAPVDKTALNTAGSPAAGAKEPRPVRVLQQILQGRGFDPGPVDGVWGSRTQSALARAIGPVLPALSADKRTVYLLLSDWRRLEGLPAGGESPAPPMDPSGVPALVSDEGTDYLPWVLGAGGLLAIGGWYMWRGKKMRRNRRRRRRSSRR